MSSTFSAEFFAGNRQRLRAAVDEPIVVTANGLLQRGADNTFPFHQDSSFWYLTGTLEPDIMLVMDARGEFLIVPDRGTSREAFDGAVDHAMLARISGVKTVLNETAGWEKLSPILKKNQKVATLLAAPAYVEQYGLYINPARAQLAERLREVVHDIEFTDIRQLIANMRVVKQAPELTAIRRAVDITIDSLELLTSQPRFRTYQNEYEFEADLTREFRFRGAAGHAFVPIIAGGKRACTLHNISNEAPLDRDSLVILDVGAEVSHYAADITRTRVYGKPSARQKQIFDAVQDVQAYALTQLKPGTILKEYEKSVETYMGKTLQTLKLLSSPDHDSIRTYYPHATSHFLGLDVHDAGDYTRPLEAGMVLTCEPGIYVPEEGIGVRLEDDILITASGNEILSDRLPKSLE